MICKQKTTAYTLAEILITLGIIGVVAAITLPMLFHKIEKIILKKQIKKTYSTLSQIHQKAVFEFSELPSLSNLSISYEVNKFIIDNLKILKICDKKALEKGCITKYQGLNISGCSGFNENNVYNNQTIYILNDGSFVIPYSMTWRSLWLVDVNGKKGPNKASYDLFQVEFQNPKDIRFRASPDSCINQGHSIKGGLNDYKNIDKW